MMRIVLILGLVAISTTGCSRFGIHDAAQRIAFARGCDPRELTIIEGYRAGYEVSGCGETAVYQCADGQCTSVSAHEHPNEIVMRARLEVEAHEAEVLACTHGESITVQLAFDADGAMYRPALVPEPSNDVRYCIARVFFERVPLGATGSRLLVSAHFPHAAVETSGAQSVEPAGDTPVGATPATDAPVDGVAPADSSSSGPSGQDDNGQP